MDLNKVYYDSDGNAKTILQMVKLYPEWAANRIQEGEKAIKRWEELKVRMNRNSGGHFLLLIMDDIEKENKDD